MKEPRRRAQALLGGLDTCLWHQLGIIADYYEDMGEEGLARAYRWFAAARMAPSRFAKIYYWPAKRKMYLPLGHQLPSEILAEMGKLPPRFGMNATEWDTMSEAYQAAAECFVACAYDPNAITF